MMKHASHQFGDWFSGFSRQSKKFSHIGTCIRCNFMPWTKYANHYDYHFHFSFTVWWKMILTCQISLLKQLSFPIETGFQSHQQLDITLIPELQGCCEKEGWQGCSTIFRGIGNKFVWCFNGVPMVESDSFYSDFTFKQLSFPVQTGFTVEK